LRAKHSTRDGLNYGVNGNTGKVEDMKQLEIFEPAIVKE